MHLLDLTQPLRDGSLSYPGDRVGLEREVENAGTPGCTVSTLKRFDPHCGTHVDAPRHFYAQANDVAALPLLVPEIFVIRCPISPLPADALISHPDVKGKAVLFSTGWETHGGSPQYFDGFPTLSLDLAARLVEGEPALVGLDSPSVDAAGGDYPVHRSLLSAGIPILEGLVNLPALLPYMNGEHKVRLAAFPLRIQGLEGSPVRAVAIIT